MTLPLQIFQFHYIAGVEVLTDSLIVRSFFEAEYGYHSVAGLHEGLPCVFLDFRLDSTFPKGFTRQTHKLLARWGYIMNIGSGEIDIHIYGNRAAVPMVHHMMVHPSLRWLVAESGTLLLHAGAVVKNGKSLILTGKGGAGKTTLTSLILASGGKSGGIPLQNEWQLHADDYVFLGNGQSKAYMTRSHLYRDLLKWVPEIGARLTPWERIRLEFLGAIRKYSGERLKWAVRLTPKRLWPGKTIVDAATPAALLLLEHADVPAAKLISVNDRRSAANELLEVNFGEARHFLMLLQKSDTLDERWLAIWKDTERTLLLKLLLEIPAYRLVLPFSQSSNEAKANLLPILEKLVES